MTTAQTAKSTKATKATKATPAQKIDGRLQSLIKARAVRAEKLKALHAKGLKEDHSARIRNAQARANALVPSPPSVPRSMAGELPNSSLLELLSFGRTSNGEPQAFLIARINMADLLARRH